MRIFFILSLIFTSFITSNSEKLELLSVEPNEIVKSFSSKIDEKTVEIKVKNDKDNVMLYIGSVIEPYDTEPDNWNFNFCYNNEGKVLVDWNHEDHYKYSCCQKKSNHTYICPLPNPETNPDPFRTLIDDDINNVYIKEYNKNSEWQLTNKSVKFKFNWNFEGFLKRFITITLIISVSLIVVSGVISRMNFFSNKYPFTSIIIHLTITIFSVAMEFNLYNMSLEDKSKRGEVIRQGLIFSILSIIYSLFLIYIPSRKDPQDPNTIEQRITVKQKDKSFKFVKILKSKYFKEIFSLVFVFFLFYQFISIYALVESSREYLELEWDGLLAIVICYIVLEVIFLVSYMSALYEIKIPIRFDNTTGQVMQFLPETIHRKELQAQRISRKVIPDGERVYYKNNFGFYDNGNLIDFDHSLINVGDLILIDEDFENNENNYSYLIWKVGYLKSGRLVINQEYLHTNRIKGCINKKHGEVKIVSRKKGKKLNLFNVVKIDNSDEYKFVKYGYVTEGYLHQDYQIILDTISTIMKIVPEYTPDYNYNIVENLRTECHRLTKKMGKYYSFLYLTLFSIFTIYELVRQSKEGENIMNLIFILLMICFAINVNTKLSKIPILKRSKNIKKINIKSYNFNHRGDNDILKCKLSYCNIISNSFEINILPDHDSGIYTYKFENLKDDFFIEIDLPFNFNFLGIGVLNNNENILKRISPGLLATGEENLIKLVSKNQIDNHQFLFSKVGFGRLKDRYIIHTDNFYQIKNADLSTIGIITDIKDLKYNVYKLVYPELNNINFLPKITSCEYDNITFDFNDNLFVNGTIEKKIKIAKLEINNQIKLYSFDQQIYLEKLQNANKNSFIMLLEDEIFFDEPFEYKFKFEYEDFSQVNFISIGLLENSYIYHNKFLDVVPGWDTSRSIGYHSDDGSICISDGNKCESHIINNLKWTFNNKNNFSLSIGFDGIWLYFENDKEKFGIIKYELLVNQNNLFFSPIVYIDGLVNKKVSIKLIKT